MPGGRYKPLSFVEFARNPPPLPGAVVSVDLPENQQKLALTVDLCAIQNVTSRYDKKYFDTLRGLDIPYTIFPSGKWMREHPDEMKQFMQDPKVQIGLHGDTHQALTLVNDPAVLKQEFDRPIEEYQHLLSELKQDGGGKALRTDGRPVAERLTALREPWGFNSDAAMAEAQARHLTIAHWSHAADGPGQMTPTMEKIVRNGQRGSIILTHGNMNTRHDADDVVAGIRLAQDAGYKFTTLDGLLKTPGAVPQRSVQNANDAIGEKISTTDILTADCHNKGGGSSCRSEVKSESPGEKREVLDRYRANLSHGPS